MPNRLAEATSPYLLQHANNPVDWHPWSQEAFDLAIRENKPVFLSIGYSACHWCHVMERESFENDEVAKIMNENFVSIKVDREERPDIDDIYMTATQLLAGHGGWPNSVFLTPDKKPYYAGTYFPPDDKWGRTGFKSVLLQLSRVFRERREEIDKQGNEIVNAMKTAASGTSMAVKAIAPLSRGIVTDAIKELGLSYDDDRGGFGNAPKFPPHTSLELLLHESSFEMAKGTLDGMAHGGIHDHVGGGFARYSTDEEWLVPHFEKMLYDNAQLSRIYVKAFLATGEEKYRRVADGVFGWVLREMTDKGGAFYSALDADSEGEEGKFYVWSKKEIIDLLGPDGEIFCQAYNVAEKGNFIDPHVGHYDGRNILHTTEDLSRPMEVLREYRSKRIWPGLDDKILVSWNGLMIESFAFAGRQLNDARYTSAATKAADYILREMKNGPRLMATARHGKSQLNAYLDDYVYFSAGLLELGRNREAAELMDFVLDKFSDPAGGFFFTSDDHEELLYRWKDPFDKAIPSGNGKAVVVFLNLYKVTREEKYLHAAKRTLETFADMMERASRAMHSFILGLAIYLDDYDKEAALLTAEPSVKVKAVPEKQLGDALRIRFDLSVRKNYTLNSLALKMEPAPSLMIETVDYPSGSLEGNLTIRVKIRVLSPREHNAKPLIRFHLSYQACDANSCHTPESMAIPLEIMFTNDNIGR